MEIEKSPSETAKKLWNIVRIVFLMMKRSMAKGKLIVDLHMLLRKGKTAGKAITNLILHHHRTYYFALTCRPDDRNTSFVSPRYYEFSCTTTPIRPSHRHRQVEELKVLDTWNRLDTGEDSPGYRDSAAPAQDHQVDRDAEEFIRKFYKDLKKQKRIAALQSPSPYHEWAKVV